MTNKNITPGDDEQKDKGQPDQEAGKKDRDSMGAPIEDSPDKNNDEGEDDKRK